MGKCGNGARPNYTAEELAAMADEFREYIQSEDIPIVAEFAAMKGLNKRYLYERKEFDDLIGWCTGKKEAALERGTLKGTLNPTMAVFSLKQLGWSDKHEVVTTTLDASGMTQEERRERLAELLGGTGSGAEG